MIYIFWFLRFNPKFLITVSPRSFFRFFVITAASYLPPTEGLSEVISVIGRRTGTIKDVVQDGDVVIQFANDTTVRIAVEAVAGARTGQIITITWEAPKGIRLEDCINLGNDFVIYIYFIMFHHCPILPFEDRHITF